MTAPSYPNLQRGVAFQLMIGDGAQPTEHFTLLASAITTSFKQANETDDAMEIDINNPLNAPVRIPVPKGQTWDVSFSGSADWTRFATLQTAYNLAQAGTGLRNFQIELAGTGANGGGIYQGAAIITELALTKNNNGKVDFTCTLKGAEALTWTANA